MPQTPPPRPAIPGGILEYHKIYNMFYESAIVQVHARYAHIERSTAFRNPDEFEDDYNTQVLFALVDGVSHATFQGTRLLDHLKTWGQTESVVDPNPTQVQHEARILAESMCEQFRQVLATHDVKRVQGFLNAQETLRGAAYNKLMALERTAWTHDQILAREAETTRKSLIVLLTACEAAMIALSFIIVFPVSAFVGGAAVTGGVIPSLGMTMTWAVWVVPGVNLIENAAVKLATHQDSATWKIMATTFSVGTRRNWGHHTFKKATPFKQFQYDQQEKYAKTSYARLTRAQYEFRSNMLTGKQPSGAAKVIDARANYMARLQGVAKAAGELKTLKAAQQAIPVVFLVNSIAQEIIDTRQRWNE